MADGSAFVDGMESSEQGTSVVLIPDLPESPKASEGSGGGEEQDETKPFPDGTISQGQVLRVVLVLKQAVSNLCVCRS